LPSYSVLLIIVLIKTSACKVIGLTNGAAEKTCHSAAAPVVDNAYTLFQATNNAHAKE
jgi:hypothetical protein